MPNPSSKPKRPRDANELAARIVAEAVGDVPPPEPEPDWSAMTEDERRSLAAKTLGRQGGLKGGKARAAKLTAEERTKIARKAAAERWKDSRREPEA
jgi:hypothetical protein